jgi:uncharacterized membrane protein
MKITSGVILGIGLGGFVDGILLHQIVHWHNMGSAILPPTTLQAMEVNMRWDGYFHAATWAVTLAGIFLLRHEGMRGSTVPARQFVGQLILGWGAFNLVEGVIDHEILGIHHVRDLPVRVPTYDWLFLSVAGVGLIVIGILVSRPMRRPVLVRDRNAA